jgi:hypothetical protein
MSHALTGPADAGYQPPRDPLEIWLARQWQHVLGFTVGIGEGFFSVGGNSLDAAIIIDAILKELGVQLPLNALTDHPTIGQLAALLRDAPCAGPALAGPLITIQDGDGTRPPLFLVHPDNGQAAPYCQLASDLGEDYTVHALHAGALYAGAEPPRAIPAIAAAYTTAVRAARPAGPYLLGGAGAGAAIAYEIAARLGNVQLLTAINASLLQPPGTATWPHQPPPQPGPPQTPASRQQHYLMAPELAARVLAVWQASQDAMRDWQPAPYTGQLDLLGLPPITALPPTVTQRPHQCATGRQLADTLRELIG